jgi:hypothetical protein
VEGAWLNRRRGRYFVGHYSETPEITVIGGPPYYVLDETCAVADIGRTVRLALDDSGDENMSWEVAWRVAEERVTAVANLAGVKDRPTYERGTRHISFDRLSRAEILVTPTFRRRGYWEPVPEEQWLRLRHPSDRELGEAAMTALERSSA